MAQMVRIFPALAVAASLLLGVKAVGFVTGLNTGIPDAVAEDTAPKHDEKTPAHAPAEPAKTAQGEKAAAPAGDLPPELSDPSAMSASEIAVLQSLSTRRSELDAQQREQEMREQLLAATEKKVNERIAELKSLEGKIVTLLGSRDQESEAQIASLVKVYESMKPKDSAKIFEKLDEDVLLNVAQRMKPQKIGAVLAEMDPVQAQSLTVQLAKRLELPKDVSGPAQEGLPAGETPVGASPIQELPQSPQESQPRG